MKFLPLLIVLTLIFVAACAQPPENVPRAAVGNNANEHMNDMMNDDEMMNDAMGEEMEEEMGEDMDEMMDDMMTGDATNGMANHTMIDPEKSSFQFEGYGPGKSHLGTFTEMEGMLAYDAGMITGAHGTIQATSVKSDGERLENHLRSEDFFHVERYPTIEWTSTDIERTGEQNGTMDGALTFHGVTKQIAIPVTFGEIDGMESMSADFLISMEEFDISYAGVNDDARIMFTVVG